MWDYCRRYAMFEFWCSVVGSSVISLDCGILTFKLHLLWARLALVCSLMHGSMLYKYLYIQPCFVMGRDTWEQVVKSIIFIKNAVGFYFIFKLATNLSISGYIGSFKPMYIVGSWVNDAHILFGYHGNQRYTKSIFLVYIGCYDNQCLHEKCR